MTTLKKIASIILPKGITLETQETLTKGVYLIKIWIRGHIDKYVKHQVINENVRNVLSNYLCKANSYTDCPWDIYTKVSIVAILSETEDFIEWGFFI